jgi:hypothetical protein
LDELQVFCGWHNTAQQGAKLKFMPTGIQSRISQHGYTNELDLIQNAADHISAPPPAAGLAATINVVS